MTTTITRGTPTLGRLTLPSAPPVVRTVAAVAPRRRVPAVVLLVLGAALVIGPVVGGLFVKVASGQQMIDSFAPHLAPGAMDSYAADLATLRSGAGALDKVYAAQHIAPGTYPGLSTYRSQAPAIDGRATTLLDRITAAEPDYQRVAGISGFERTPFLLVAAGLALAYAGAVLLRGRRQRAGGAVVLALVASVALIGFPLVSSLPSGSRAGERLLGALAPVMTPATVLAEQRDFVVLVTAVGELDTSFKGVARDPAAAASLRALDAAWPRISSDLAGLIGAINDNITDYQALDDLDGLTSPLGVSGLVSLPWFLLGAGGIGVLAAAAALPRRRKELL